MLASVFLGSILQPLPRWKILVNQVAVGFKIAQLHQILKLCSRLVPLNSRLIRCFGFCGLVAEGFVG
ncbi:hypothetical protein CW749_22970 [Vibrio sp. vnigr-6D03]|nr:hypothetical protein CW749_22970 [Vibrio sp. vnigr-6D03]